MLAIALGDLHTLFAHRHAPETPYRLFAIAAALAIVVIAPGAVAGTTVQAVTRRGELVCGVASDLHGFSAPDSKGQWSGLDVDVCRAVAAAVFGDAMYR
jgi:general L-amino acid transport system substrate-binding protein